MYRICSILGSIVFSTIISFGQTMTLQGGNMSIVSGTVLELAGPLTWNISPGASLVNDGVIELGSQATLVETNGEPITGNGTEHASRNLNTSFSDNNIGGLGLVLSLNGALGPVDVTRGHTPLLANGTIASVARWYQLEADPVQGDALGIVFQYEPSELNGTNAEDLIVHRSDQPIGNWFALSSSSDVGQQSVSTSYSGPWEYLTLFDEVIEVSVIEHSDLSSFAVFPTATTDRVQINALGTEKIERWELISVSGALLAERSNNSAEQSSVIDLSGFPVGTIILRLNGAHSYRLLKL